MASGAQAFALMNKRTIRQETNPMDKATILSIFPKRIHEFKYTIQPGEFIIEPGSKENPSILVVGPSSWWRDIGEEMPLIEITNSAIQIADSIIKDYCNGLLMSDMDGSMPGLFFVPGELTVEQIVERYPEQFKKAVARQHAWFNNLVRLGDAGWAQTNGNPRSINDLNRMAATALGLTDRPWMASTVDSQKIPCVACGNLRNPQFPICPSCNRIVDQALAQKLGIVEQPVKK